MGGKSSGIGPQFTLDQYKGHGNCTREEATKKEVEKEDKLVNSLGLGEAGLWEESQQCFEL